MLADNSEARIKNLDLDNKHKNDKVDETKVL